MHTDTIWANFRTLTSAANPHYQALKKQAHNRRARAKDHVAILEGTHLLAACIDAGWQPELLCVSESGRMNAEITDLVQKLPGVPGCVLPDALFCGLSSLESPGGVLTRIALPEMGQPAADCACVLLEDIQDPGNLGTILRTTAAAGVQQILLSRACADAWSPKTLRAGMGAHFQLRIYEHHDLAAFTATYAGTVVATALAGSKLLYEIDLRGCCAFVFGNEGAGLSAGLQALATQRVRIPMPGRVESLNVGAAAAICLFERVRQLAATGTR